MRQPEAKHIPEEHCEEEPVPGMRGVSGFNTMNTELTLIHAKIAIPILHVTTFI